MDPTNIKNIDVDEFKTVGEADKALDIVSTAIVRMQGQLDYKLAGGTITLRDISTDDRKWFIGVKQAMRYAKATRKNILLRREAIIFGANQKLAELRSWLDRLEKGAFNEEVVTGWKNALDNLLTPRPTVLRTTQTEKDDDQD